MEPTVLSQILGLIAVVLVVVAVHRATFGRHHRIDEWLATADGRACWYKAASRHGHRVIRPGGPGFITQVVPPELRHVRRLTFDATMDPDVLDYFDGRSPLGAGWRLSVGPPMVIDRAPVSRPRPVDQWPVGDRMTIRVLSDREHPHGR